MIATPVEGFRSWDAKSQREDGGAPGGFDVIAANYLLRNGLTITKLIDVFRHRVEAATWPVRFFTPSQKEEVFVEVDPREARAIGYHKYQDEKAPGPQLEQPQALEIARSAFAAYKVDPAKFDLKEALNFQQEKRRDWLFHFEEKTPIAGQGFRRASIRVAGATVTQFNITIKVPDAAYREAVKRVFANVVLIVVRIAGAITLLALVVGGFVVAAVRRRPRWLRAFRWSLALAIIPIASIAASYEDNLFGYNTSVNWHTFRGDMFVSIVRDLGVRIGLLFIAFAAIDAAIPFAYDLLRREARARFGRSAAIAAITTVSLLAIVRGVIQLLSQRFPAAASVSMMLPEGVAQPMPSLIAIGEAIYNAVIASGIVASLVVSLRSMSSGARAPSPALAGEGAGAPPSRRRWWTGDLAAIAALFCVTIDPGTTPSHMPLMIAQAAAVALTTWIAARFILNGNVLAWPLTIFTALALQSAAGLAQNSRTDLRMHAIVILVAVAAALIAVAAPRLKETHA